SVEEVLAAWSGLGYYRRARMLHEGAKAVAARGAIPHTVDELMSIPGIGRYTAGAIASIAFQQRAAIVDGNIARVIARLEAIESPLGSPALMREVWSHAETLVAACEDPRTLNQSLMELGALVCTPRNPRCGDCPVRGQCRAFAENRTSELPRPAAARAWTVDVRSAASASWQLAAASAGGARRADRTRARHFPAYRHESADRVRSLRSGALRDHR